MLNPFTPGVTTTLRATGSTSAIALGTLPSSTNVISQQVLVTSPAGGQLAFLKFGTSGVQSALTETPILSGASMLFTPPGGTTHMAGIVGSSSQTLYVTVGQGG